MIEILEARSRGSGFQVWLVVLVDEVPECSEMVLQAFGKWESLPDKPRTVLSEGTPEPFDVIGQAISLARRDVLMGRDHGLIGQEEVGAARGVIADLFRQRLPQAFGGEVGPVADGIGQHPPGFGIQNRPDPEDLLLGTYETPQFIGFDHDRDFSSQKALVDRVVDRVSTKSRRCKVR